MDSLKKSYAGLGFINIQSYIQSGNVVFRYKKVENIKLEKLIKEMISGEYGFDVPVIVKEFSKYKSIIENNPFIDNKNADSEKFHVTFLSSVPAKSDINKFNETDYTPDKFVIYNDVAYLYIKGGYSNSKLSINLFEKKLKINATNRNWKTVNELYKIAGSIEKTK